MKREEAKRRLLNIEHCTPIHTREDARDFAALEMAIQALSQEPCDKCVYSTKDGYCQYDDIAEIIPSEQEPTVCDIERDEKWLEFTKEARKEAVNAVLEQIRAELHATAEMHEDGDYYLRDEWIDEYFDKYTKGNTDV